MGLSDEAVAELPGDDLNHPVACRRHPFGRSAGRIAPDALLKNGQNRMLKQAALTIGATANIGSTTTPVSAFSMRFTKCMVGLAGSTGPAQSTRAQSMEQHQQSRTYAGQITAVVFKPAVASDPSTNVAIGNFNSWRSAILCQL